jgi:hypothetical protein
MSAIHLGAGEVNPLSAASARPRLVKKSLPEKLTGNCRSAPPLLACSHQDFTVSKPIKVSRRAATHYPPCCWDFRDEGLAALYSSWDSPLGPWRVLLDQTLLPS